MKIPARIKALKWWQALAILSAISATLFIIDYAIDKQVFEHSWTETFGELSNGIKIEFEDPASILLTLFTAIISIFLIAIWAVRKQSR